MLAAARASQSFVSELAVQDVKKSAALAGNPACSVYSRVCARIVMACSRCVSYQNEGRRLSLIIDSTQYINEGCLQAARGSHSLALALYYIPHTVLHPL